MDYFQRKNRILQIHIRLYESDLKFLDQLAEKKGTRKSTLVRTAVREFVERNTI